MEESIAKVSLGCLWELVKFVVFVVFVVVVALVLVPYVDYFSTYYCNAGLTFFCMP